MRKNINLRFKSKMAEKLSAELRKLITVYQKNFYHAQKLKKQAHNRNIKLSSCILRNKVWLNNKYTKTK